MLLYGHVCLHTLFATPAIYVGIIKGQLYQICLWYSIDNIVTVLDSE